MTTGSPPGARAQNKARTRAAIRAAALDLVSTQGYHETTVAQIAEAAGVSHTTLFRYFESKEQVLVGDDLDERRRDMLEQIPLGLGRFDLLRRLVTNLFEIAGDDPWASDPRRIELLRAEPVLHAAHQFEVDRAIQEMTAFFADYTGTSLDALPLRVFIAAASGVMVHLAERSGRADEATLSELLAAIDLLEQGLPL